MNIEISSTKRRRNTDLSEVFVDFISHVDNLVFFVPAVSMFAWVMVIEPGVESLGWFLLGWMIFLPQEYLTHVYILHAKFPKYRLIYRIMYRLHYGHHDLPRRSDLMYMPLWLTIPMTAVNMVFFAWITETWLQWMMALSGLFVGYLVFEFTHLLCHVPRNPKNRLGKLIRNRHLWHHYRNEKHWFSVSLPALFIDNLCNTAGTKDEVGQSGKAEYLGWDKDHPWLLEARKDFAHRSSGDESNSKIWLITE